MNNRSFSEVMQREGRRAEVLADLEQVAVLEFALDPRTDGAGPHVHRSHVDTFVVLDGELEIHTAKQPLTLHAGEVASAPPGTVHGFRNAADAPVRFLNVHTPAQRFVEYLRRLDAGEDVDVGAYDMHPPDEAGDAAPVAAGRGAGERFDRGDRVVTILISLPQLSLHEIAFDPSFAVSPHVHDDQVDSF